MKQFDYTIKDELGIHARPAGLFAKLAKGYGDTVITVTKGDQTVKASQLMKLMGMAIKNGETITVAPPRKKLLPPSRSSWKRTCKREGPSIPSGRFTVPLIQGETGVRPRSRADAAQLHMGGLQR